MASTLKEQNSGQIHSCKDGSQARVQSSELRFTYVLSRSNHKRGRSRKPPCSQSQPGTDNLDADGRSNQKSLEIDSCSASAAHSMSSGGFTYVEARSTKKGETRRKGRTRKLRAFQHAPKSTIEMLLEKRENMKKGLWLEQSSTWLKKALARPGVPTRILHVRCLALGPFTPDHHESPSESGTSEADQPSAICSSIIRSSQYQLLFFLDVVLPCLKAHTYKPGDMSSVPLAGEREQDGMEIQVSFYDPAFRATDKEYLRELGYVVHDEEQPLSCDSGTFFYIPHGPLNLYANLLRANHATGTSERLGTILLFGNDLSNYLLQTHRGQHDSSFSHLETILKTQQLVSDEPPKELKSREGAPPVFNHMSLQWFSVPHQL